jgi:hypothetical protein
MNISIDSYTESAIVLGLPEGVSYDTVVNDADLVRSLIGLNTEAIKEILDTKFGGSNECSHTQSYVMVDKCGFITLRCDCSVPLAEIGTYCSCEGIGKGKDFVGWNGITKEEVLTLLKSKGVYLE